MDKSNGLHVRSALVAYGSETGNAYDYSEELERGLERLHFSTHVSKLNDIDTASLQNFLSWQTSKG